MHIYLDIETRSKIDLGNEGLYRYAEDDSTDILLYAYLVEGEKEAICTTIEGDESKPPWLENIEEHTIIGHNIMFEMVLWEHCLTKRKGWRSLGEAKGVVCTMELCCKFNIPSSLARASKYLGCHREKMEEGKGLIQRYSIIKPKGYGDYFLEKDTNQGRQFRDYCKMDVMVTQELLKRLPLSLLHLLDKKTISVTRASNHRGVEIDTELCTKLVALSDEYEDSVNKKVEELIQSEPPQYEVKKGLKKEIIITKPTQNLAILAWIQARNPDVTIKNIGKGLPPKLLEKLDPQSQKLLKLKDLNAHTAFNKQTKALEVTCADGRARGNMLYHGAITGRYSSRGLQLQNFYAGMVEESELKQFLEKGKIDGELGAFVRKSARQIIKLKKGYIADYASIEPRIAYWLSGDKEKVKDMEQGHDPYIAVASSVFDIEPEDVTPAIRSKGKLLILMFQYGGGIDQAMKIGDLSEDEARELKGKYEEANPHLVRFRKDCLDRSILCLETERTQQLGKLVTVSITKHAGTKYLVYTLPSGRKLCYSKPRIIMGGYRNLEIEYGDSSKNLRFTTCFQNINQSVAACFLMETLWALHRHKIPIAFSIHDEIVAEYKEGYKEQIEDIANQLPSWAKGFPMARIEFQEVDRFGKY